MRRPSVLAMLLTVLLAACGSGSTDTPEPTAGGGEAGPRVVVTTSILGDVVREVAGDAARIEVLIPPGVDPHGYSPSSRDAARLRQADLVVANGLDLEESLLDVLEAAEEDGVEVLHVGEQLDPLPNPGPEADEEDDHGEDDHGHEEDGHEEGEPEDDHAHGGLDPHVWLDPLRMSDAAELIAERLAEVDGPDGLSDEEWADRGARYAEELRDVDGEIEELLSEIPDERRLLVTGHDNLRYFADRYGFEVVGTVIPGTSSQAQPSTREMADLAAVVAERGVPAIFTNIGGDTDRLAATLAAEVGRDVEVVTLYTDALGEEGSGAETLVGLLRTNARRIADALH